MDAAKPLQVPQAASWYPGSGHMPGLSMGRVVHYRAASEEQAKLLGAEVVSGRVSRLDDASFGLVTIHLDVPPPKGERPHAHAVYFGAGEWVPVAVVVNVPHDDLGGRGTWRLPPRA